MRKTILTIVLLCIALTSYSQYFARLSTFKITEEFGQIYNNSVSIEIGYSLVELDDRFNIYTGFGFFHSTPKESEYFGYGTAGTGSNITVTPSKIIYGNLDGLTVSVGGSYNLLDKPFTPFASMDMVIYIGAFSLNTEGFIDSSGGETISGIGLKPDIGLLYTISDAHQLQLKLGKLISASFENSKLKYWQTSLSYFIEF